jgi:hypothetical protein
VKAADGVLGELAQVLRAARDGLAAR